MTILFKTPYDEGFRVVNSVTFRDKVDHHINAACLGDYKVIYFPEKRQIYYEDKYQNTIRFETIENIRSVKVVI